MNTVMFFAYLYYVNYDTFLFSDLKIYKLLHKNINWEIVFIAQTFFLTTFSFFSLFIAQFPFGLSF